jgi:hypothetical protein
MIAATAWAAAIAIIFVVAFYRFPDEWKAIFRALAGLLQKTKKFGLTGIEAQENPPPPNPDQRQAAEDFFRAFDNPLVREQEDIIRADLNARRLEAPNDRERALIKSLATWQILFAFEQIHGTLWASQYAALRFINQRPAGTATNEVTAFYEAAKAQYPLIYEHYDFEAWLRYLVSNALIVQQEGNILISIRGRAYLQYLVETGKSEPNFG